MNCTTCKFSERKSGKLLCRRFPPTENRVALRADDWCGEYKERPAKKVSKPIVEEETKAEEPEETS